MQFELKTEEHTVGGQTFTLKELTAEHLDSLGDDFATAKFVALSWAAPGEVTVEQVSKWPASIVAAIAELASKLNGFEGN